MNQTSMTADEKVKKYEEILESALQEKVKKIYKITSGPFEFEGKNYYRVSDGSSSQIVHFESDFVFKNQKKEIKNGTDVIVFGNLIVGIIPEKLEVSKDLVQFDLIGWDKIGGLKSQLETIRNAVETPLLNLNLTKEFGIDPLKGILLYGHPGCGKTLIAKAIASTVLQKNHADKNSFIYIKGAELLSKYVGATEERIVSIFTQCRNYSKNTGIRSVVFIDEAEALLPERGSRISSDVDKTIVPTFLSEMDGFEGHNPFIILSSNLPDNIDSAILRDGRIDLKIEISRPSKEDSYEIFEIHFSKSKLFENIKNLSKFGTDLLFEKGINVSGALIETCVKKSTLNAFHRYIKDKKDKPGITTEDVRLAIETI